MTDDLLRDRVQVFLVEYKENGMEEEWKRTVPFGSIDSARRHRDRLIQRDGRRGGKARIVRYTEGHIVE